MKHAREQGVEGLRHKPPPGASPPTTTSSALSVPPKSSTTQTSGSFTATIVSVSTIVHGLRNSEAFESEVLSEEGDPT
jgi:hypothetical protein